MFSLSVLIISAQVDLGGGHEVEFVMAPNLHWPDTMFSFDHATGTVTPALYKPAMLSSL